MNDFLVVSVGAGAFARALVLDGKLLDCDVVCDVKSVVCAGAISVGDAFGRSFCSSFAGMGTNCSAKGGGGGRSTLPLPLLVVASTAGVTAWLSLAADGAKSVNIPLC